MTPRDSDYFKSDFLTGVNTVSLHALVTYVQLEAEAARAESALPESLGAVIGHLSHAISHHSRNKALEAILARSAAPGLELAADLQQIFCEGSLLTRICTAEAIRHQPHTVGAFLDGIGALAGALPRATVDYAALTSLAHALDCALAEAEGSEQQGGAAELPGLHLVRLTFVSMAGVILSTVEHARLWGLGPASTTLEVLLHLAMGELSAACQLVTEQRSSLGQVWQAALPQLDVSEVAHGRALCATRLMRALLPLARVAATMGYLSLQRLVASTPDLIQQRMRWVSAAAAFAKVLHAAADAAAGSASCGLETDTVGEAVHGLDTALVLVRDVFCICFGTGGRITQGCLEAPGPQHGLTQRLRHMGFLAFVCLPALAQAHGDLGFQESAIFFGHRDITSSVGQLLIKVSHLQLLNDAVRGGGLSPLLSHFLYNMLVLAKGDEAVTLLLLLSILLTAEHAEGLAVAVVKGGLLQAVAEHSASLVGGRRRKSRKLEGTSWDLLTAGAALIAVVCTVLDENASTRLQATFSTLLEDVPSMKACTNISLEALHTSVLNGSSTCPVGVPQGPWVARFHCEQAWAQEASLALSKCTGCGEARYCSKQCQRQDWRRHKAICQAIKELK
ncbi:hypothetical protein N2152v2_002723 [Parachlorella kessleri]